MAQSDLIQVRVDGAVKRAAEALFSDLGLDTPTAVRMFLAQSIKHRGLPFEVREPVPNAVTIAAMEEADRLSRDPNAKRYANAEELFKELRSECTE